MKHIDDTSDLPPRTWRGWWLAWPKWFRIGCWAGVGWTLLNVALVVRIYIGLQEPAEMVNMRERYIGFRFAWQNREVWDAIHFSTAPNYLSWDQKLISGLHGHSWSNVIEVDMSHFGTSDDLRLIAARCPYLEILSADGIDVSAEALASLQHCKRLSELDLSDTDVDDVTIKQLTGLSRLALFKLKGTLVGDPGAYALMGMPSLVGVDLMYTDVTQQAIYEWNRVTRRTPVITFDSDDLPASVLWGDGVRSGRFSGAECKVTVTFTPASGRLSNDRDPQTMRGYKSTGFTRGDLRFPRNYGKLGQGNFRFTLQAGKCESLPLIVDTSNGLWPERIEFQMPCTKAEALASANLSEN